jgi:lantibiotic modifying enzyme
MVMINTMFLDEAVRIGRFLTGTAIRHAGRCTWLDDDAVARNGWWSWKSGTLGSTFGAGTAGVGWFMARLSSIVQDRTLATISTEALRQSLQTADDLLANRKLGFQDGALGLAWALVDAGRSLQCD